VKNAVFVGRFAVLTRAHLSTAETILRRWSRLTVGVLEVTPSPPPQLVQRFGEFYKLCLSSCGDEDNPFSVEERIRLWRDALHHAGLTTRGQIVEVIQPELNPEWFNRRFPPRRAQTRDSRTHTRVFPVRPHPNGCLPANPRARRDRNRTANDRAHQHDPQPDHQRQELGRLPRPRHP
jgi:hypothetical protein